MNPLIHLRIPNCLPIKEAAQVMQYAYCTVWQKVRDGTIKAVKDANGMWHVPIKEIKRIILLRADPPKKPRKPRSTKPKINPPGWILNRRKNQRDRYASDPEYKARVAAVRKQNYQRHKAERSAKAKARYAQKKAEEVQ